MIEQTVDNFFSPNKGHSTTVSIVNIDAAHELIGFWLAYTVVDIIGALKMFVVTLVD